MSDEQFVRLFENSLDALAITDDAGRYLDVNPSACRLFGYPRERLVGQIIGSVTAHHSHSLAAQYQAYLQTGQGVGEFTFVRADGEMRVASYSACRVCPNRHLSILRDVTPYKEAEKALAHLAAIIQSSNDAIVSKNLDGIVMSWNPAAERIYGYAASEIIGKSKSLLIPPELPEELPTILRRVRAGERIEHYDTVRIRKDGRRIHLSITVSPVRDGVGQIIGASTIARDISERVLALKEIEALNTRLQRSIRETHHRVKNNLQIISALTDIETCAGQEFISADAMRRIGQHARMLAAIHDLLTQQARADGPTDVVSIRAAMDKLVPLLQATTGGRQIRYRVHDISLPVRASASLALLVSEIISNAVKHGQGDISLTLDVTGETARLEISDEGPGFPPDFDWQAAANTGLSLIDSAGRYDLQGVLAYRNKPEGGACVSLTFPTTLVSD